MDELLARAGSQAVSFAIKSSVSIASTYALKQFSKFLTGVPPNDATRLQKLRKQLETRIDIINNAIGLIKLCVVRGNTNLGSTLALILDIKEELHVFNDQMNDIMTSPHPKNALSTKSGDNKGKNAVVAMEAKMNDLIHRIELVIPLISLSMTTSGVSTSMTLPNNVSPSLLLQASSHLMKSNQEALEQKGERDVQVGPRFEVTVYNVFDKSSRIVWKEQMARCDLRVIRSASKSGGPEVQYEYYLELKENFDDSRYHDLKDETAAKSRWPLVQVVRLFFTVSGKLLNLEERDSPVLVLKLDRNMTRENHLSSTEDIEWIALGEYEEPLEVSDSEDDSADESTPVQYAKSSSSSDDESYDSAQEDSELDTQSSRSLSLLQYIIKLASLQGNDQTSILEVKDERLSLYLQDENPNSIRNTRRDVKDVTARMNNMSLKEDK